MRVSNGRYVSTGRKRYAPNNRWAFAVNSRTPFVTARPCRQINNRNNVQIRPFHLFRIKRQYINLSVHRYYKYSFDPNAAVLHLLRSSRVFFLVASTTTFHKQWLLCSSTSRFASFHPRDRCFFSSLSVYSTFNFTRFNLGYTRYSTPTARLYVKTPPLQPLIVSSVFLFRDNRQKDY